MNYKDYYNNKSVYGPSKQRINNIVRILRDISGKKILDIACGDGTLGLTLKNQGAVVDGCDISEKAVGICKAKLNKCFICDLENDDFYKFIGNYDVIIASEIIEHLFDPKKFLFSIKSYMKDDAILIITTPNFLMWTNRIKIFLGKFEYAETGFLDESHIHFFSYNSLKNILIKNGFKIIDQENIIHPKVPGWLGRIFPNLFVFQIIFKIKL